MHVEILRPCNGNPVLPLGVSRLGGIYRLLQLKYKKLSFYRQHEKPVFEAGFFYAAAERRSDCGFINIFIEYANVSISEFFIKFGIDRERSPVFKPRQLAA